MDKQLETNGAPEEIETGTDGEVTPVSTPRLSQTKTSKEKAKGGNKFTKMLKSKFQRKTYGKAEYNTYEDVYALRPVDPEPGVLDKLQKATSAPEEYVQKYAMTHLNVKVVAASGLRSADSNGLSDPYCVITLGSKKTRTRVEEKSLNPNWNETFVFSNERINEALESQLPFIMFEVWDSDGPVMAADFLGQAEVDIINANFGDNTQGVTLTLPLYAIKGGKKYVTGLGELTVSLWTSAVVEAKASQGSGRNGSIYRSGSRISSSLVVPPNVGKSLPLTTHADGNTLYEEPCMAYALLMVWEVKDLVVTSAGEKSSGAGSSNNPALSSLNSIQSMLSTPSRLASGGLSESKSSAKSKKKSDFGDLELIDEDDDMDELWGNGSGANEEEEEDSENKDNDAKMDEDMSKPDVQLDAGSKGKASSSLVYYRIRLNDNGLLKGKLAAFSSGKAEWSQPQVFGMPLPLSVHKKVKLSVYYTSKRTKVGRVMGRVWIRPFDVLDQVTGMKVKDGIPEGMWYNLTSDAGEYAGRVRFAVSFVDVDIRRRMYKCPLLVDLPDEWSAAEDKAVSHSRATKPFNAMANAARAGANFMIAAANKVGSEGHGEAAGDGADSSSLSPVKSGSPCLPALPPTPENQDREVDSASPSALIEGQGSRKSLISDTSMKSEGSEGSASEGVNGIASRTGSEPSDALAGNSSKSLPAGKAGKPKFAKGARRLLTINKKPGGKGGKGMFDGKISDKLRNFLATTESKQEEDMPLLGTFKLVLEKIELVTPTTDKVFVWFKCGPHWGMTKSVSGKEAEWNWEVKVPIYEPSTLLIMCLFSQQAAPVSTLLKKKNSASTAQLVGKLRVRLNTIKAGEDLHYKLPMLCDRSKDKIKQSATATLQMQVDFPDTSKLLKQYLQPLAAEQMYYLDIADQVPILNLHVNHFVMEWLDEKAKPAIPTMISKHVIGQEQFTFFMSRLKLNGIRIKDVFVALAPVGKYISHVQSWQNPWESGGVVGALSLLMFFPSSIIGLGLLLSFLLVLWKYVHLQDPVLDMEPDPEAAEDDDPPEKSGSPYAQLKRKYSTILGIVRKIQAYLDEVATHLERLEYMFSWQDPIATAMFAGLLFVAAMGILIVGFPFIASFVCFWILRPPFLRTPTPPPPLNIYGRLPSRADRIA